MRSLLALCLLALTVAPVAAQTAQTFANGLVVTFPEGWDGPAAVDESALPGLAIYQFENSGPDSPLRGTTLRIERLMRLNPMMQERWYQGRVPYGYNGARPVAPLRITIPDAVAFETTRTDGRDARNGHVYFVTRGPVYWAINVEAPAEVFEAHRQALVDLVYGLQIGS